MIIGFISAKGNVEGGINVSIGAYLGAMLILPGFVCPMIIFFSKNDIRV